MKQLGEAMAEVFAVESLFERLPVLNHEERRPIDPLLRDLIWRRDHGVCWICGRFATDPVLDHLRPRSNWPADELDAADRSDNLHLACWVCNAERSNLVLPGALHPVPVVVSCARCNPGRTDGRLVSVYCGGCGFSVSVFEVGYL